jgi:NAD(P)-dependent dehydrogenase (short-subunit alcohol dehydrogenase family)
MSASRSQALRRFIPMTKIAVITGANRGLGFATARRLGQSGVHVVVGARTLAKGQDAAAQLRKEGLDAEPLHIDVDSVASVQDAARQVEHVHGRIDILINNAGILPEATAGDADPLDLGLFRQTFETNVFGAVAVTKAFLPLLRKSASGRIVNVSSTMGSLSDQCDPSSQYYGLVVPAYQMSKAALNGLTIALSKTLTDTSIKVNSICPGWVQTDLGGPENRAAAPTAADDAAQIVVDMALVSDDGPTGRFVDAAGTVAW